MQTEMPLKFSSFLFRKNSVQRHLRGPTAWAGYWLGEPCQWCAQTQKEIHMSLCLRFSYAPLQQLDCRKLSPVVLSSTALLPSPHKPGWKIEQQTTKPVCIPDSYPQHWATAGVYAAEAVRLGRTVLCWHLNNNCTFSQIWHLTLRYYAQQQSHDAVMAQETVLHDL